MATRLKRLLSAAPELQDSETVPVRSVDEATAALEKLEAGTVAVAAGGDGTVALMATALRNSGREDTPLGLVPLGTANILAHELGVEEPTTALRALREGDLGRVDIMCTTHPAAPVSLVAVSCGFEGRFMSYFQGKRHLGRGAGAIAGLFLSWGGHRPILLELDGEVVVSPDDRVFSVGLYNTRCYAWGVVMSPDADVADGWGEAVVYESRGAYLATVGAGMKLVSQRPSSGVVRRRWLSARIETEGPFQIDGESVASGSFKLTMEAGALRVVVPAGSPLSLPGPA